MSRLVPAAFATAFAAASLSAAIPAIAASAGFYQAELAAAPAKASFVAKNMVWNCAGTACAAASRSPSRPVIVCGALARQVGPLTAFAAGGTTLTSDELARCNKSAN